MFGANLPLLNFYKRAKALGYETHSFAWTDGAVCSDFADYYYPISYTDIDKVAAICKENKVEAVTAFSLESALPYVYKLAQKMGWSYPSLKNRTLCENKLTMRKEFALNGVSIPFFEDTADIGFRLEELPVIVKPIDSGGSRGVTKVSRIEDLSKAIARAKSFSSKGRVLIEQYIDGPEYSVEAISHNGIHHIVAITEKVTSGSPNFVELAHFQPALLSESRKVKLMDLVEKALTVLDYTEGPSHTEVRFDHSGNCFIIEVGTRLGGDFISSDLVRLSTGYDMVQASIELSLGNFYPPQQTFSKFSGVYFKCSETMQMWKDIELWKSKEFCVESDEWSNESKLLTESADRSGYFIFQHDQPLKLNGVF